MLTSIVTSNQYHSTLSDYFLSVRTFTGLHILLVSLQHTATDTSSYVRLFSWFKFLMHIKTNFEYVWRKVYHKLNDFLKEASTGLARKKLEVLKIQSKKLVQV